MTAPQPSFWTEYGPNRFETLLLGAAGGLLLAARIGVPIAVTGLLLVVGVSYVIRKYVKV